MKKGDTRGLSTVVATLLIILLVIVSIAIVWGVIRTVIKNNAESISLGQFTISLEIVKVYPSDVYSDPNATGIKIRRNAGAGELDDIIISIFDGRDSYVFTDNIPPGETFDEFEVTTFPVPYTGDIVSVSISPIFSTSSGKPITGDVQDTYYVYYTGSGGGDGGSGGGEEEPDPDCVPDCIGKACGDDGCFGSCGSCISPEECISESCTTPTEPCVANCACSSTTCSGTSCSDGCGGSCPGIIQPNCGDQMCGAAPNGCGSEDECGTCSSGWCDQGICCQIGEHNIGGICQTDCNPIENCLGKECGPDGCGGTCGTFGGDCEYEYGSNYFCNESGICELCIPDCTGKECGEDGCGGTCGSCTFPEECNATTGLCLMCEDNCLETGTECGDVPNGCGESCGECIFPETCTNGICVAPEASLNSGTVTSVWPVPIGHNFLTGSNLPEFGETSEQTILNDAHYVRITSIYPRCYPVLKMDYPINPGQYTVIQVSTGITDIEIGDSYQLWETLAGCQS
jgi:hypothetical protein